MSETVVQAPTIPAELEAEPVVAEYIDPSLDDARLTSLVSAHASLLVKPSWAGGADIALGASMSLIKITHESLPAIVSEVEQLVLEAMTEDAEPDEELAAEEEELSTEELDENESTPKFSFKFEIPDYPRRAKAPKVEPVRVEAPVEPTLTSAYTETPTVAKPAKHNKVEPKFEPQVLSIDLKPEKIITKALIATPALKVDVPPALELEKKPVVPQPEPESNIADLIEAAETTFVLEKSDVDEVPEIFYQQPEELSANELDVESLESSLLATAMPTEQALFIQKPIPEIESQEFEGAQPEQLEPLEIWLQASEGARPEQLEPVANVLLEVVDKLEEADDSTVQVASQTLETITEVAAQFEAEPPIELEDLFEELLDTLEIDYQPELIDSLVGLAIEGKLANYFIELNNDPDKKTSSQKTVKKMLAGKGKTQKTISDYYELGRSALRLYVSGPTVELSPSFS